MSRGTVLTSAHIAEGLTKLQELAFVEGGPGDGAEILVYSRIMYMSVARGTADSRTGGVWGFPDFASTPDLLGLWLKEVRRDSYVPGRGTWISCRVYLYPDADGVLQVSDDEFIEPLHDMPVRREEQFGLAGTLITDLRYFPRTVDNIPAWMWTAFRDAKVTPPYYDSDLSAVDWNNRRRPVTDTGTDFEAEPVIVDPSKEPSLGVRAWRRMGAAISNRPGWVGGVMLALLAVGGHVLHWAVGKEVHPMFVEIPDLAVTYLVAGMVLSLILLAGWARGGGGFRCFLFVAASLFYVVGDFVNGLPGLAFIKLGIMALSLGAATSFRRLW